MTQVFASRTLAQSGAEPRDGHDRAVAVWLLVCAAMIFVMVLLGGITRLSGSGLSIMEWKPLMGTLPPMSTAEWERVFALYREISQYKNVNHGMSLAEFQGIFWWEYSHRLWGRLIGIVFFLPFLWFLAKGYLRRAWASKLGAIFLLGALQGGIGWYMVASGFEDRDSVSQYRLVLHLGLALIIYALILWCAFDLLRPRPLAGNASVARPLRRHAIFLLVLIAIELALGGLVAGLHGGLIYNDFPFMNGDWIAPDVFSMSPWWVNPTENPVTAQFLHRIGAGLVTAALLWLVARVRRSDLPETVKARSGILLAALVLQVALGISTLMLVVPLPLAVAHQGGAVILLTATLYTLHGLKRVGAAS
ncbi:COX15/CtaA family protein [Dongia sedimenti]|uniref:Heme A synthase n=1 Tax=Dongia sedimenti TaxID=3064282 RepID=A0ABU0YSS1_9PROT|nr:COX15/CtaA family protein [Rhodospirillaceae bacterium R-7]